MDADGVKVELKSEKINVSPLHYYGGSVFTVEQLKLLFPEKRALIENVEDNRYRGAILCRTGMWEYISEGDVYVDAT